MDEGLLAVSGDERWYGPTNPGASGSSEVKGADQVAPLVSGIVNKAGKDPQARAAG